MRMPRPRTLRGRLLLIVTGTIVAVLVVAVVVMLMAGRCLMTLIQLLIMCSLAIACC